MDTFRSIVTEPASVTREHPFNPHPVPGPGLGETLRAIRPLPCEGLFLGQAEDDRPVLLNLYDATVGPLLIRGNPGTGKTHFLRAIAKAIELTHAPAEIQYGVITPCEAEWRDRNQGSAHALGVFPNRRVDAKRLIQSLALWAYKVEDPHQAIVVLIDDLSALTTQWDSGTLACLREMLKRGPAKLIWTVASLKPSDPLEAGWLEHFGVELAACPPPAVLFSTWNRPLPGPWFCMQEQGAAIRFWIPAL